MNCYLKDQDDDVICSRIRTKDTTTLFINVGATNRRRPDEFYKESESILQDPEIIYTVTDAIDVEQGAGGFVNRIKAMHDQIADEQAVVVRRNSARSEDLTEQIEAAFGKNSRRSSFRSSQGGTPRSDSRSSRSSTSDTPTNDGSRSNSVVDGEELSPQSIEFIRAESEIVYSLSDDTGVEQGASGFVQLLRKKHESIGEGPVDKSLLNSKEKPYPV